MRGNGIKIKNALKTIKNDELRTKIVKPQNLFVSSAVSFLCENAYLDRKKQGGANRPFFEGEGVQIAHFSLKGGAKFAVQKRRGVQIACLRLKRMQFIK